MVNFPCSATALNDLNTDKLDVLSNPLKQRNIQHFEEAQMFNLFTQALYMYIYTQIFHGVTYAYVEIVFFSKYFKRHLVHYEYFKFFIIIPSQKYI